MSDEKIKELPFEFQKRYFEKTLLNRLAPNNILSKKYYNVMYYFWSAGLFLDSFIPILKATLIKHDFKDEKLIRLAQNVINDVQYNEWFETNMIGFIHFVNELYQETQNVDAYQLFPIRTLKQFIDFGYEILDSLKSGEINFDVAYQTAIFRLVTLFIEEHPEAYDYALQFADEFAVIEPQVRKKWKNVDGACTMLTDDELKTYIYEVYDDEKQCLTKLPNKQIKNENLTRAVTLLLKIAREENDEDLLDVLRGAPPPPTPV